MLELNTSQNVLVIGGGVGGIRTALDLAESGLDVILIDKAYAIGGLMTQLDRTFPTNNCDLCTVSQHLSESGRRLHIDILPLTSLEQLSGEKGAFQVTLKTEPRFIDITKCTACGACHERFPQHVRFTPGLDPRAPTCMRYPQATPYAYSIDMSTKPDFDALIDICPAGAILPEDTSRMQEYTIGSVVLAPGAELYHPAVNDNLGWGQHANVVTGLEYERIMSASGPTQGELRRPSDGKKPQKIAWMQCVGSRGINQEDVSYCSSVCCMYALKEAIVTKERFKDDIETVIFYMDMRTFGKGYESYTDHAKDDHGVKLIRSRPHSVIVDPETQNLLIRYIPDDTSITEEMEFDMVVLSTGFRITDDVKALAEKMEIDINTHGFAQTADFSPVATSRPGVYVCGIFEAPKDIPETMIQASAAACMAGLDVTSDSLAPMAENHLPPEKDVTDEPPRVGVFICDCGVNIGGVIDVDDVVADALTLKDVVVAECIGHGCSSESLKRLETAISEHNLNRVVIGGCSPRTHETKFQDTLRRAGLNRYLVEIANLRDQDTWVHAEFGPAAVDKAKELIRMAVGSVKLNHPLTDHQLTVEKSALVIGGGVSGMNAALQLARQGVKVSLVEKNTELGGVARDIRRTLAGDDVRAYVADLVKSVSEHPQIQVYTRAIIVDHAGMPGRYTTGIQVGPRMQYLQIKHGVTIFATGSLPNRPQEYLLDSHKAVKTQLELGMMLEDQPETIDAVKTVVMIQCVGSRVPENPNCSRVCCQAAIKNALLILERQPDTQIFILYRDMRTYGFQEDYYLKAREKGVIFIRHDLEQKPQVMPDGDQVSVTVHDPVLGQDIVISADLLALSTGFIADDEATEELALIFHIPRTPDGYLLEDHIKLRPTDLSVPGFFVAGTAHAPKNIRESIAQAQAAAGRTRTILARDLINLGAAVAKVDGKKCAACLVCVRACPYNIPFINADGYSEIDASKCHGCGICAAECPAKAIQLLRYEDNQVIAKLEGLFQQLKN